MVSGKRWLVTGVSAGFGWRLAEAALARGDSVAGTVRQPEQVAGFEALAQGRSHAILLDVTDRKRIRPAVEEAVGRLGGLDILVNNAGYGLSGALEELQEDEIDHVIDTNLNGVIHTIRAALPALRDGGGHIVNMSSLAGMVGLPGLSTYCAAKFAVEGLSEALQRELEPFGIAVTAVAPGAFRTDFATRSKRHARAPLAAYDGTPAGDSRDGLTSLAGKEPGDPAKAAAAILRAVDAEVPPTHLVLGKGALHMIRGQRAKLESEMAAWEGISLSTELADY